MDGMGYDSWEILCTCHPVSKLCQRLGDNDLINLALKGIVLLISKRYRGRDAENGAPIRECCGKTWKTIGEAVE